MSCLFLSYSIAFLSGFHTASIAFTKTLRGCSSISTIVFFSYALLSCYADQDIKLFFSFRACQQLLHLSRLLDITALEFVGEVLARESELVVLHDVGAAVGAVDAGSAAPATNL